MGDSTYGPDESQHSPNAEDLRVVTPHLKTLEATGKVGDTMLRQHDALNAGVFVPAVALVMLPREMNEAEESKAKADRRRVDAIKRALTLAQKQKKPRQES